MNTNFFIRLRQLVSLMVILLFAFGCERDVTNLEPASFPTNPEVFIDGFSPGLNYAAFGGSVPTAFDVDKETTYNNSAASMRFEVPDVDDPRGAYAGGVFFTSVGRDLSGYNAITFWAKASQSASIDVIGLGNDLGASAYQVSVSGLAVNTSWKEYIIPIPDPSRLKAEKGMLYYSVGPKDGKGFTFWIDEVKFENLGTIAYAQPAILLGQDQVVTSFTGVTTNISGLSAIFNLPNGVNTEVNIAPSYFEFLSSNEVVATVNERGSVSVIGGPGTAVISATMNGVEAKGSITINSMGVFQFAPEPTHPAADVISLFSDAYTNVPVDYYNGYWAPYQTTTSADFDISGDHFLQYNNFNFVGIQFSSPTINASSMTHLRMDIFVPGTLGAGAQFKVQVVDFGADGVFGGSDNTSGTVIFTSPTLVGQNWISLDIPLSSIAGLSSKAHLGQIILEGTGISGFYADNIYFHK